MKTIRRYLLPALVTVAMPTIPLRAQPVQVAVYAGPGAGAEYVAALESAMAGQADLVVRRIQPADILAGGLNAVDVLVMPGGGSGGESLALGPAGRDLVRAFLRDGGGYVGVCAGAYLATTDDPANLRILDAKLVDADHWWRGVGTPGIRLTTFGQSVLGVTGSDYAYKYVNGPLLAPAGDAALPDYAAVATFSTEIVQNGAPAGVMIGTTAIATAAYGAGRVFVTSGHPELTPGLEGWIPRAARWAGRRVLRGRPIALRASTVVNVRSGPGPGYAVVGTVPAGHLYAGAFRSGGWWRIDFNGAAGWTNAAYYAPAAGVAAVKVTADVLNVRSGPGTANPLLGTVAMGQVYVLAVPTSSGGWYQIFWGGRTGWVYGGYVLRTTL